jgi:hypothetical protein
LKKGLANILFDSSFEEAMCLFLIGLVEPGEMRIKTDYQSFRFTWPSNDKKMKLSFSVSTPVLRIGHPGLHPEAEGVRGQQVEVRTRL